MDENTEKILSSIKGLYDNQEVLNEKINSILEFATRQQLQIDTFQQIINQQSMMFNNFNNKILDISNKLSDIQIQFQNNIGDISNVSSDIQAVSNQVENLRQVLEQWKLYATL